MGSAWEKLAGKTPEKKQKGIPEMDRPKSRNAQAMPVVEDSQQQSPFTTVSLVDKYVKPISGSVCKKIWMLINGQTGSGKTNTALSFSEITRSDIDELAKKGHPVEQMGPFLPMFFFDFELQRGKLFSDKFPKVSYVDGMQFSSSTGRNWDIVLRLIREMIQKNPEGGTFFFDSASWLSPWVQGVAEEKMTGKFGSTWDLRSRLWTDELLKLLKESNFHVFFSSREVGVWKDKKPVEGETKEACWKELPYLLDFIVNCYKETEQVGASKLSPIFQHYIRKRYGNAVEEWVMATDGCSGKDLLAALFPLPDTGTIEK